MSTKTTTTTRPDSQDIQDGNGKPGNGKPGNVFVDIHMLRTRPFSNPNRDDMGAPKTGPFGGVTRARESSQSIKHHVRAAFRDLIAAEKLGCRTKLVPELVTRHITGDIPGNVEPLIVAALTAGKYKIGTKDGVTYVEALTFLSDRQVRNLAAVIVDAYTATGGDMDAAVKWFTTADGTKATLDALTVDQSYDIALFGRMHAGDDRYRVDAACHVAHALSVHQVENEFDTYTAVDDVKTTTGAAMMGTTGFNSATMYYYATVNMAELVNNTGSVPAAVEAVTVFVKAFLESQPRGKVASFANHTLPDAVLITVRDDSPTSLVNAFETPVQPGENGGYMAAAASAFTQWAGDVFTERGPSLITWTAGIGEPGRIVEQLGPRSPLKDLPGVVGDAIEGLLE